MSDRDKSLAAIVLAGQRSTEDPLLEHTGASCKALVEIVGKPVLLRVLDALSEADKVGDILLAGPDRDQFNESEVLREACSKHRVSWNEPLRTPSLSAYTLMQSLPGERPVLLTSADQPFLKAELVDSFCDKSLAQDADVTIGLAPYSLVRKAFPDMKKTVLRFSDGEYCGCNLFAFLSSDGRRAADHWRAVEEARKSPLKVIRILGWLPLLRYRLGWLSLPAALDLLSRRFSLRIRAVILAQADAAIDVDTVDDYEIVQRELARRGEGNLR
ncbi:MAG: hypothetical protein DRR06_13990 [Gammaproteobacteria bacterium]|nr:MAG: hypothetical protein DRR06_13990 [Gammaproteobacteria bacterium]RLA53959.1 MAG: hypothetical protein DRR42_03240 [Gammaproteobacteria bacterium]